MRTQILLVLFLCIGCEIQWSVSKIIVKKKYEREGKLLGLLGFLAGLHYNKNTEKNILFVGQTKDSFVRFQFGSNIGSNIGPNLGSDWSLFTMTDKNKNSPFEGAFILPSNTHRDQPEDIPSPVIFSNLNISDEDQKDRVKRHRDSLRSGDDNLDAANPTEIGITEEVEASTNLSQEMKNDTILTTMKPPQTIAELPLMVGPSLFYPIPPNYPEAQDQPQSKPETNSYGISKTKNVDQISFTTSYPEFHSVFRPSLPDESSNNNNKKNSQNFRPLNNQIPGYPVNYLK